MMITVIDTNGKVLQGGTGGGLRVMSECGICLFELNEVSDETCINVFIRQGEEFKAVGFLPKDEDSVSDLEILIPREEIK